MNVRLLCFFVLAVVCWAHIRRSCPHHFRTILSWKCIDFHEELCGWHFKKSSYYKDLWSVMESYGDMDQAPRITTPNFIYDHNSFKYSTRLLIITQPRSFLKARPDFPCKFYLKSRFFREYREYTVKFHSLDQFPRSNVQNKRAKL